MPLLLIPLRGDDEGPCPWNLLMFHPLNMMKGDCKDGNETAILRPAPSGFLRKPLEKEDHARKMHVHPFLCCAEAALFNRLSLSFERAAERRTGVTDNPPSWTIGDRPKKGHYDRRLLFSTTTPTLKIRQVTVRNGGKIPHIILTPAVCRTCRFPRRSSTRGCSSLRRGVRDTQNRGGRNQNSVTFRAAHPLGGVGLI